MIALLETFRLPTQTDLSLHVLTEHALSDKKRNGDQLSLILPATIGCCKLVDLPVSELKNFVKEGM